MALEDITIDTNVLEHANNTQEERCASSIELINYLLTSSELLCLDHQPSREFKIENSIIWNEYTSRLTPGMLGHTFITRVLSQKRIKPVSRNVNQKARNSFRQNVKKPVDIVFLKVAFNSNSKILVSHDFEDFQIHKRELFNTQLNIQILVAQEVTALVS